MRVGNLLNYFLTRFFIELFRFVPFRLVYALSDLFYYLLYYIIGYRRKVVRSNLISSFPAKNQEEIIALEKKFYHHLCDITLESLKGFTMSKASIVKRHRVLNPDHADAYIAAGRSVISTPAHYNNWEWGSMSPGLQIKSPVVVFYKPLSNNYTDVYARKSRARCNTALTSIKETASAFAKYSHTAVSYIMAADQSPTNLKDCFWIDFLNHDTPCIHGPEKYARLYNYPVVYVDIRKVKRGFYEITLVPVTENPCEMPDGEITARYMKLLENSILNEPAYWLWSHKRWKHSRENQSV